MPRDSRIIDLAFGAGEILLKNGAEISRVNDTVTRILQAFHIKNFSIYLLSNGIFLSAEINGDHRVSFKHIPISNVNLGKIAAVNELSRKIGNDPDMEKLEMYENELKKCGEVEYSSGRKLVMATSMGSAAFCYLFRGSIFECVAAAVCGIFLYYITSRFKGGVASRYMPTLCGSAAVSLISMLLSMLFTSLRIDHIIIGSIIPLVPGVSFTTSIRDFFNGDYISGTIRMIDAVLIAVCIAAGVGSVIMCMNLVNGGFPLDF